MYKSQVFFFQFLNYFIVVQLQLSAFSPHPSTPPQPNPPPSPASILPLGFVHVSFDVVPENLSPHYPLPTHLWLLFDCTNFSVSGYILFAFFFCFILVLFVYFFLLFALPTVLHLKKYFLRVMTEFLSCHFF